MTTEAWPTTLATDPGGPCAHCPPLDQSRVTKDTFEAILRLAPDQAIKIAHLVQAPCSICGGTGFTRVCRHCNGLGCLGKIAVKDTVGEAYEEDEEYEVEAEISTTTPSGAKNILKPAVMSTRKVSRLRDKVVDAWTDGPGCPNCKGSGQESVTAEQVASG